MTPGLVKKKREKNGFCLVGFLRLQRREKKAHMERGTEKTHRRERKAWQVGLHRWWLCGYIN